MFTYLGASTEMDPDTVTPDLFDETAIAMIEGYLLFNPDLMFASVKAAKAAGSLIALDLASFEVVEASRHILTDLIRDYVDILIANEDEALAYTGHKDETKVLAALSENATTAVLKVGKRGVIFHTEAKQPASRPRQAKHRLIPLVPVTSGRQDSFTAWPTVFPSYKAGPWPRPAATKSARSWVPRFPTRHGNGSKASSPVIDIKLPQADFLPVCGNIHFIDF